MAHGSLLNAMCQPRWQGGWGEDGYMCCAWLSPFAVHLRPLQHCSWAIPQYKIQSLKFGKKNKVIHAHNKHNLLFQMAQNWTEWQIQFSLSSMSQSLGENIVRGPCILPEIYDPHKHVGFLTCFLFSVNNTTWASFLVSAPQVTSAFVMATSGAELYLLNLLLTMGTEVVFHERLPVILASTSCSMVSVTQMYSSHWFSEVTGWEGKGTRRPRVVLAFPVCPAGATSHCNTYLISPLKNQWQGAQESGSRVLSWSDHYAACVLNAKKWDEDQRVSTT